MAYLNSTRATSFGIGERIATVFRSIRDAMQRRRVYQQTLRELNTLSNRELADLGLHRAMLTRVAIEAAYGN
jgi:uncharacterized protein YjiS (DUF1127 family)